MEINIDAFIMSLFVVVAFSVVGIAIINIGTTTHELFMHNYVAQLLGCEAVSGVSVYSGVTTLECPNLTQISYIIIALVAPIGCFILGMFLWNWDKDSYLRAIGGIIMFYSSIPSLYPLIPASDMAYAINHGFNPSIGWALYVLLSGICFYEYILEVKDKPIFNKVNGLFNMNR